MNQEDLKSKLSQFRYKESESPKKRLNDTTELRTSVTTIKKRKQVSNKEQDTRNYKDLQPSLTDKQILLFIGFNPGIESSLQQHHYAHFSNLFWKLFNESQLFLKVLSRIDKDYINKNIATDKLLQELVPEKDVDKTYLKPKHDFEIIKYRIGFTDLVLRCTKTAQELSLQEKLANIPRLVDEFNSSGSEYIIFIGKGIWEMVLKYMTNELSIKRFKLSKLNFSWGRQEQNTERNIEDIRTYNLILSKFKDKLSNQSSKIYVFPNTSGLVGSLKYSEKLDLWNDLANDLVK
ncbi:uracil-DNA glycosylase-like protein [Scheffersomyces amazonensis]|uniref:uracil-DNA glycosylase-like protein n=1 Tax=Scheffersomyces amazonensis TaxID=1078765 RepID=UPI00315DC668